MARIRVLPHLVADESAVAWGNWFRVEGEARPPLPERLLGWDYDQGIHVTATPSFDAELLLSSTALPSLSNICLVAIAECAGTQRRFISKVGLVDYLQSKGEVEIAIPPGEAAGDLVLSMHLVLRDDLTATRTGSASRAGSRLAVSNASRLVLEGSGSRFPTEAVAFSELHLEPSAWTLIIDFESLEDAFPGSVRLLVNTEHPVGLGLAESDPRTVERAMPFLRIDIVRQLLANVGSRSKELDISEREFDEDAVGHVAETICSQYLNRSIRSAVELIESDPVRFERLLQARMGLDLGGVT